MMLFSERIVICRMLDLVADKLAERDKVAEEAIRDFVFAVRSGDREALKVLTVAHLAGLEALQCRPSESS